MSTANTIASAIAMPTVASASHSHFSRPCAAVSCNRSIALCVSAFDAVSIACAPSANRA